MLSAGLVSTVVIVPFATKTKVVKFTIYSAVLSGTQRERGEATEITSCIDLAVALQPLIYRWTGIEFIEATLAGNIVTKLLMHNVTGNKCYKFLL